MLTRREWIARAALGSMGLALAGCATRRGVSLPPAYRRPLSATPFVRPRLESDQVIRTVVGLRPFRPSGFVVRAERMGEKTVIHNYGHGGGGITLSWGSSALAVREAAAVADRRAAVLGAGIMGLTTARLLQDRGWSVTIYTDALPPHTTSNVAGGQWAPTSVFDLDRVTPAFQLQFKEAARLAHHAFQTLVGAGYGVTWKENYFLNSRHSPPRDNYYVRELPELFPSLAELGADEHPFPSPFVYRFVTMLIEPGIFLMRTLSDVRAAGGRVVIRRFLDRSEVLSLGEPVIFNCTGLGAASIFGDAELVPVRGQLVFMPPDDRLDYLTIGGGDGVLYMFPRADGILLGGTFERGASHLTADQTTTDRIVNEHIRIVRAMRLH
jgi:glycine/D-amino acid oxidase-like deaminating enzyme